MQRMASVKTWYDFWQDKHGTTFCFAVLHNSGNLEFAIDELSSFAAYIESKRNYRKTDYLISSDKLKLKSVSANTINAHIAAVCNFLIFLTDRYVSVRHLDASPSRVNTLRAKQILRINTVRSALTVNTRAIDKHNSYQEKFRSLTPKMMDAVMLISRPSTKKINNKLNPWKSSTVQWRNYIMIRLLDHYGLRAAELLLLTLDSIKPNLSGGYSMVVTAPLDSDPRQATNLSIKNRFLT